MYRVTYPKEPHSVAHNLYQHPRKIVHNLSYTCHVPVIHPPKPLRLEVFHMHTKVGVPNSNIAIIWTPIFEWCVVRCGS